MVFGVNLFENVRRLAEVVRHVEIVLFSTPGLHNIPGRSDIEALAALGAEEGLSFSVHLPASYDIASRDRTVRESHLERAIRTASVMQGIRPLHQVLHVPLTRPTLTHIPGSYITDPRDRDINGWHRRGLKALSRLCREVDGLKLLVENINYSPVLLEPFWKDGPAKLCLDVGHLLLGREPVMPALDRWLHETREIHLHGVLGDLEHLSLAVLPAARLRRWVRCLAGAAFEGVVNLEVFSPEDLQSSLAAFREALPSDS